MNLKRLSLGLLAAIAFACPSLAGALAAPEDRVVPTASGAIDNTNAPDSAEFDLAMLDALPQDSVTGRTPWYDDSRTFSGPLISAILEAVGAHGKALRVTAVNDYSAEIPVSDIEDYPVILATRIDGATLSVREKGPGFVIYPFDKAPELYNEKYFGRSVWQVTSIEIF